jgi:octaprenyl-diphosphate synthase
MPLESIRQLVARELQQTDALIEASLATDVPLAAEIAGHIVQSGGKRVRPMIVLLMAKALNCDTDKAVKLAAIVELLHTATLLHDDVVDESGMRRGRPTANANWGNEASVLVGDLLYAKAFQLIADLDASVVTQLIASATSQIVEGEVLQLSHCHDTSTTEADYFDIIKRKTGQLFAVASSCAPILMGLDEAVIHASFEYGMHLGIAFQIMDDALDYDADPEKTGKNLGDDLQEGKPTLPLLYILKKGTPEQIRFTEKAITSGGVECLDTMITTIQETKAIDYTRETAKAYADEAIKHLSGLDESPAKKALADLACFAGLHTV